MDDLKQFGWNEYFSEQWKRLELDSSYIPARVTADFGSVLKVATPHEKTTELSGHLLHFSRNSDLPKVGDWVAVRSTGEHSGLIEAVLPRQSEIARRAAGDRAQKQVMAANIDIAFVMQALDHDFSPRRVERYLYQLAASNIKPVLLFNKADMVQDMQVYLSEVESLNVPYIICSAKTGQGLEAIRTCIEPGNTAVLLGSSGVGKSTLTNQLLGETVQKTQEVRIADSTGRHTTTHRELFILPGNGLLIDTPGIRELQLWGVNDTLDESFDDVVQLSIQCKFNNCSHSNEAGCAVQAALSSGELTSEHFDHYRKLKAELADLTAQIDKQGSRQNKRPVARPTKQQSPQEWGDDDLYK